MNKNKTYRNKENKSKQNMAVTLPPPPRRNVLTNNKLNGAGAGEHEELYTCKWQDFEYTNTATKSTCDLLLSVSLIDRGVMRSRGTRSHNIKV